ncbi:hypothetical protein AB0F68_13990 [Micromonospora sp. NPDC023966]|uniref:hypothetical protein n=1 Tax=Micromonospora sp. NPDC023966 TaxID=3154699 RepID=UPI0033C5EFDD
MTTLVTLAVVGVVVAVAVGYVSWRDRRRSIPDEDRAAGRSARARQSRYEGERHAAQGDTVQRAQRDSGPF